VKRRLINSVNAEIIHTECDLVSGPDSKNNCVILFNNRKIVIHKNRLTPVNKEAEKVLNATR
jgi:hypothetical protein